MTTQSPAGYSGTPLPRKLGIKPGSKVSFPEAPESFAGTLGELPDGVRFAGEGETGLDLVVFFVRSEAELRAGFSRWAAAITPAGMLWIAWPKKASGVRTDLTEDVVRKVALENGLVDVKVAAIDATWSGLKLVVRLKDRPGRT
jgi:hypothetical protein